MNKKSHIKFEIEMPIPEIDIQDFLKRDEAGDGELFARLFIDKIVFDHSEGKWYLWNEHYWQQDLTGQVTNLVTIELAEVYIKEASLQRLDGNFELSNGYLNRARKLTGRRRVENVLWWASRQPGISLTGDEWDKIPDKLPVMNGVLNLNTGKIESGNPQDFLRSAAPVEWHGIDEPAPIWEETLSGIFDDNDELISFMQRLLGYAITGETIDHVLPIFYGDGRNGKGTIMETLGEVLGSELSISTQAGALMDSKRAGDAPQPFIYQFRGKRLTWASESKEGSKLNVGLVKQLTGGDTLNVRTLHSKPVSWKPTHKVFLLTNNKPHIPADDQAAWDRVLLIPFDMRFVDVPDATNERKRDPYLREKILKESSGILAWLVRGCLEWRKIGLNPPDIVKAATQNYRDDEDTIGAFIDERCKISPVIKDGAQKLYDAYQDWANSYGLQPMSMLAFAKRMRIRFGEPKRESTGKFYIGVGLS